MKYLDEINNTEDLKKLNKKQLNALAREIRWFLIKSLSKTGGHLASNLGVVELTIALHYVFDSPKDKLIWDVGHQAYIHKILTGRKDGFDRLRKKDGLSGFPKPHESEHDAFVTGHSSTSISVALGYCVTRDLAGDDYHVISVIGDGSMTGGLAYEALNNAGRSNTNLIVILNDNEMSISKNVGAVSRRLNEVRTELSYIRLKKRINEFLDKVPVVGSKLGDAIEKTKEVVKYLLVRGIYFEELGFKYIGPVDGHSIEDLTAVLNNVKHMKGPVLLHVYTTKGKGYQPAENNPAAFHGVDSFDIATGKPTSTKIWDTYSDVFGKTLTRLAYTNKKIVAVTAAMSNGTGLEVFEKAHPDRHFDVGIAEGHAVTFSAGMAKNGYIPFFVVYSSFLQRSYDQIVHDMCLDNLHVVLAIDRAGVVGADGETHNGIFDLSFLSHIPNLTIIAPRNKNELISMVKYAAAFNGPIAIRYPRGSASLTLKYIQNKIVYGKCEKIYDGKEIALISVGTMMDTALAVYERLKSDGHSPQLINLRFIKPIDTDMIESLAAFRYVFVIEDNVRSGGAGSKILEAMAERDIKPVRFRDFAFPDTFVGQGSRAELFEMYGMDENSIYNEIAGLINTYEA